MNDEKYVLKIPIKNIYYMLSYAFGILKQGGFANLDSEDFENIYDLLAEILIKGIESQIKRGIYKEYIPLAEPLSVLRGKIEISELLKLKARSSIKPTVNYNFCENYKLSGNNIYMRTLDLNGDFADITYDLKNIAKLV